MLTILIKMYVKFHIKISFNDNLQLQNADLDLPPPHIMLHNNFSYPPTLKVYYVIDELRLTRKVIWRMFDDNESVVESCLQNLLVTIICQVKSLH